MVQASPLTVQRKQIAPLVDPGAERLRYGGLEVHHLRLFLCVDHLLLLRRPDPDFDCSALPKLFVGNLRNEWGS